MFGDWVSFAKGAGVFGLLGFIIGLVVGRQSMVVPASVATQKSGPSRDRARAGSGGGREGGSRGAGREESRRESRSESGGTGRGVELYVGNLPYETTDRELAKTFERFGRVLSVRMIENRRNGKPKGFGFVEMENDATADAAIKAMNGADFKGRSVVVNEAKSRARRD